MKKEKEKGKKGEMSIGIIIAAVLALIVLVVLIIIFSTKTGQVSGGISDCEGTTGGECMSLSECRSPSIDGRVMATSKCKDTSKICCQTLGS